MDSEKLRLFVKFCAVVAEDGGQVKPDEHMLSALLSDEKSVIHPSVDISQIIAIVKTVCAVTETVCPVVNGL